MKLQELTRFVESTDVGSIVFHRVGQAWEVWAYDHEEARTLSPWGNRLDAGRTGEPKTYTSLDRAHAAIRKLGYTGPISIDG